VRIDIAGKAPTVIGGPDEGGQVLLAAALDVAQSTGEQGIAAMRHLDHRAL
jgi:hypothetical protein